MLFSAPFDILPHMENKPTTSNSPGVLGWLFLILCGLKVAGVATLSWWAVFAPLIIWLIAFIILVAAFCWVNSDD